MTDPTFQRAPALPSAVPLRLAIYFSALFLLVGIQLPFWPVWLESRGLGPTEIGLLIATGLWAKVLINPVMAHVADRSGERRRLMILLAWGTLAGYALFLVAGSFWSLFLVTVIAFGLMGALGPLGENITLLARERADFDYGRVRLWGSLAFIGGAGGAGWLLSDSPPSAILWMVLGGSGLLILCCVLLPDIRSHDDMAASDRLSPAEAKSTDRAPLKLLLTNRPFLLMLLAAALIQGGHAVYYGFATLHWRDAGLSPVVIGWLWAEGVIAEVILFAIGGAWAARLGPSKLLLLAGAAGVLRWTATGLSSALWVLLAVQALHAFTFGAAHLAAMNFIARQVPARASASAQSLYSSIVMGAAAGVIIPLSGMLYTAVGGAAFHAMAGLCLAGAGVAILLARTGPAPIPLTGNPR